MGRHRTHPAHQAGSRRRSARVQGAPRALPGRVPQVRQASVRDQRALRALEDLGILAARVPAPPRSVDLRVEIGSLPRRDRFGSGSRSVEFRVEIGPGRSPDAAVPRTVIIDHPACPRLPAPPDLCRETVKSRRFSWYPKPLVDLKACGAPLLPPRSQSIEMLDAGPAGAASRPRRTDLGAELDRSRRGTRPISVRK